MISGNKKISFLISSLLILVLALFYSIDSPFAKNSKIYKITLSSDTQSIIADGTASATITAKVKNRKNKPVSDEEVKFSIPSGEGILTPESAFTDENGKASVNLTSTKAGRVYVMAKIRGVKLTGKRLLALKVKRAATLTLTADPATLASDGKDTATITAVLKNEKNNPISGQEVTFEADHGVITSSDTTNDSGIATATLTSDSFNGDVTVTAKYSNLSATTTLKFVAAGLLKLSLSLSSNTIPSDGTTTVSITATLTDATNKPIPSKTINFSNALDVDGDGTISSGDTQNYATFTKDTTSSKETITGTTNADGQVTGITISTDQIGSIVIKAEVEGTIANAVLKAVTAAELKGVTVKSADTTISVNGGTTTITATFQNATSGTATFTATLGYFTSATIIPIKVPIDSSGVATATLTSGKKTGLAEVKVSRVDASTGERIEGSTFVRIVSKIAATIELSASPNNIAVNTGTSTITARVKDADGNPVAGELVGFKIVNSPGGTGPKDNSQLSSASAVTDSDGIATVNFLAGALETSTFNGVRVDAFLTSDPTIENKTFLTISGRPFFISIAFADTPTQNADSSLNVPITALISDVHGNPVVDGTSVSFGVAITRLALGVVSGTGDFTGSKILNSEDINQNGALDAGEDINNNGVIDFIEDVNGNGQLDTGEDLDGNGKLNSSALLQTTNVLITKSATTADGVANATLLYGLGLMERYQVLVTAEAGGIINSQYFVLPHTLRKIIIAGTEQTKEIPTDQTAFIVSDLTNKAVAPAGPTGLTVTTISSGRISLSWTDNSGNESGFEIERSTTSGSGFTQIANSTKVGVNATTYIDSTAVLGTTYFYRVRAINSSGNSSYSNETSTSVTKILPPSNLTVSADASNQIFLMWTDNSDNETGFIIERSVFGSTAFTEIARVGKNVTFYKDGQISPALTYFYKVKAFSETDSSLYSNEVSHRLVAFAPSNLIATTTTIPYNLTWTDNSANETGFEIERSESFESGFTKIGTVLANVTTYSDATAVANTTYYYRVRATISGGGVSGYSNVISPTGPTINPPSSLVATGGAAGAINISWTDNSTNELGFVIEEKTKLDGPYKEVLLVPVSLPASGTGAMGITVIGLTSASQHFYRARAFNGATVSDYSNEDGAIVP